MSDARRVTGEGASVAGSGGRESERRDSAPGIYTGEEWRGTGVPHARNAGTQRDQLCPDLTEWETCDSSGNIGVECITEAVTFKPKNAPPYQLYIAARPS